MLTKIPAALEAEIRKEELEGLANELLTLAVPKTIALVAEAGTGKSVLLRQLHRLDQSPCKAAIIDAGAPANRTRLGLATAILSAHPDGVAAEFLQVAADARRTGAARLVRGAIELFETNLSGLREQQQVIYLDNIDRGAERVILWLQHLIQGGGGPTVVGTARPTPLLPTFERRELAPFTFEQLELITSHWAPEIGVDSVDLAGRLHDLTGGNGVRVMLAVWAVQATKRSSAAFASSLDELLWRMARGTEAESRLFWLNATSCKHRVTPKLLEILCIANGATGDYDTISRLPFASAKTDSIGGYVLHQIAAQSLEVAFSSTEPQRREIARRIYDGYPRLMSIELDQAAMQALYLERLSYLSEWDVARAVVELQTAFDAAARTRDICRADDITKIAEELASELGMNSPVSLKLLIAETAILDNQAEQARVIISTIPPRSILNEDTATQIRYNYNLARCSTCPAPIIGADLFKAVSLLAVALETGMTQPQGAVADLTDAVRFELASALKLIGRNHEALTKYEEIAKGAVDPLLRIRALEEEGQLLRLMQDLPGAKDALARANAARFEHQIGGTGLSTYFQANIRRDSNEFEAAEDLYIRAETEIIELGDDHALCELNGDYAWMRYLEDNILGAREILEKGAELARRYQFGRELSEYWHMCYHFLFDETKIDEAYDALDRAFELAVQYGNVYMQLDCLMHMVQRAVTQGRIEETFSLIRDLEAIELQGAGIVQFRGRALVYQGDGLLTIGEKSKAFDAWCEGLLLVARFGNSRTNVELLGDLVNARRDMFKSLQAELGRSDPWPTDSVTQELPELAKLLI